MAIGLDFLSKTKMGALQNAKNNSSVNTNPNNGTNSIFANQNKKTDKNESVDMANMATSDLIKYVYQNNGGDVDIQNKTNGNKDGIKLPITVEYGDKEFAAKGKEFNQVVNEICQKTGDSKSKVESELKRKYSSSTGTSLNMQA